MLFVPNLLLLLLNPDGESHILTEISDKEIYHTVMDSIEACENIDTNGGNNVDDETPIEPCPTCRDVLKALSTIGKCIKDSNDPIAHKLDTLLGSFKRQLCLDETWSMRDTAITDFFRNYRLSCLFYSTNKLTIIYPSMYL